MLASGHLSGAGLDCRDEALYCVGALSLVSVVLFSLRSVCDAHVDVAKLMACVYVGALLESRHYYERVLSCFLTVNPQIDHYGYRTVLCCFEWSLADGKFRKLSIAAVHCRSRYVHAVNWAGLCVSGVSLSQLRRQHVGMQSQS